MRWQRRTWIAAAGCLAACSRSAPPGPPRRTDGPWPTAIVDAGAPLPIAETPRPGDLRPRRGLLVGHGTDPHVQVGISGAIVTRARTHVTGPPPYTAPSECSWRAEATPLPWSAFAAGASPPAELPMSPCSPGRPAFRPVLVNMVFEPGVVVCAYQGAYRCELVRLGGASPPAFELPAADGAPTLADYDFWRHDGVVGVQLGRRGLTATISDLGRAPVTAVLVRRMPFDCGAADCTLVVLPHGDRTEVAVSHRTRGRLEVDFDERGLVPGSPRVVPETGDPTRSGPLAIDAQHRLVRRYLVGIDVPIEGFTGTAASFEIAIDARGPFVAWLDAEGPVRRARVARMNMFQTALAGPPVELDLGDEPRGEIALESLSGHAVVAWSQREGADWVVRAAELTPP